MFIINITSDKIITDNENNDRLGDKETFSKLMRTRPSIQFNMSALELSIPPITCFLSVQITDSLSTTKIQFNKNKIAHKGIMVTKSVKIIR